MWVLTVFLLLATGEYHALTFPAGRSIAGEQCLAVANDAWRLNEAGLHVIAATCARVKEA